MEINPQQLKAFLLDANLATNEQLNVAQKKAEETGRKFDDVLISEKIVPEENLINMKAYIWGIPFVSLEKEKIPKEILTIIPEPIARSHNIVAFRKNEFNNSLEVAMLDPEDLMTIEFIKKTSDLKISPRLTNVEGIKAALKQYGKTLEAEFGDIIKKEDDGILIKIAKGDGPEKGVSDLMKTAEELPVIKIVDTLIKHAILERASDIHIEPMEKEVLVRYRIDGVLRDAMILPNQISSGIVARIKILSKLRLDERRLPQDGRFKIETSDYKYSFRVSILPVFYGEKVVIRLLPEGGKPLSLKEIGITGKSLENIEFNLKKPVGMILIAGPTGSGKTTTLYSMMEILNTPDVNISTLEDPIEYQMARVNQSQTNQKIGFTFASGLRSLVRQDPDIIMVGEIRDGETASLAVNASLTGHMVLSTIHTTSAAGTIPRLIDMGVEPFLISSTLSIVIAQRLVRRLSDEKQKYTLSDIEIEDLKKQCDLERVLRILKEEKIIKAGQSIKKIEFFKPVASKKCPEGYKGRIGIYETIETTGAVRDLIMKRATADQIQEQAQKEGMRTMVEDGLVKAAQGITSIEEILRVISE